MATSTELQELLKNVDNVNKWLVAKEMKVLPELLMAEETPQAIVKGIYDKANGLLVATNKRLLFLDKGWFSMKVKEIPWEKVSSLEWSTGWLSGEITLTASGTKEKIEQVVPKESVKPFVEKVRQYVH